MSQRGQVMGHTHWWRKLFCLPADSVGLQHRDHAKGERADHDLGRAALTMGLPTLGSRKMAKRTVIALLLFLVKRHNY